MFAPSGVTTEGHITNVSLSFNTGDRTEDLELIRQALISLSQITGPQPVFLMNIFF